VVYDLGEGIDQLPVLEHAMNEVWIQAKNGSEELDLIHYAMAGGMPPKELPPEDRPKFDMWFNSLPPQLQDAYQHPGLSQIIDTHANKLYLSAADHYNQNHSKKISSAEAQLIIKVAFVCLTKMDEGRAVRNRMTLQEITDILAKPELSYVIVGGVLDIFREPGNTFLRPYISEDPESKILKPDTVLDITHESLIRNWELLLTWANEEYDHLTVYEDFKKQLDRWVDSNRSKGFLLPIGPLTFFENWHNNLRPNKYWVNRYLDPGRDKDSRLNEASQIIKDTQSFLNQSANKVRVTRLIIKYGAARITTIIGSVLIIALCGFYYLDARKKETQHVISEMIKEGDGHLADTRFKTTDKANFLIAKEFLKPGSFNGTMDQLPFDQKFEIIRDIYGNFLMHGGEPSIKLSSLFYGDSVVQATPIPSGNMVFLMDYLNALNIMVMTSTHYLYNHADKKLEAAKMHALLKSKAVVFEVVNQFSKKEAINITLLNDALENILNNDILGSQEVTQLLELISPFENRSSRENFNYYYPVRAQIQYSRTDNFRHNAGYQELAYLYSSKGDVGKVKSCVDSLVKYHPNYSGFSTNILNICTYLFKAGYVNEADELLTFFSKKQNLPKKELYELWLDIAGFFDRMPALEIHYRNTHNPNIELRSYDLVNNLCDQYYGLLRDEYTNVNDLNYHLALYYKHRGIILSKIDSDKGNIYKPNTDSLFGLALNHYQKLNPTYLGQTISVSILDPQFNQLRNVQKTKADLFCFPDHFPKVRNSRYQSTKYFSDIFIKYIFKNKVFSSLFSQDNYQLLEDWIYNYEGETIINWDQRLMRNYTLPAFNIILKIDSVIKNSPADDRLNSNRLRLHIIDHYINDDNLDKVVEHYRQLNLNRIAENFREGRLSNKHSFF
jgi:hypothetical protein